MMRDQLVVGAVERLAERPVGRRGPPEYALLGCFAAPPREIVACNALLRDAFGYAWSRPDLIDVT